MPLIFSTFKLKLGGIVPTSNVFSKYLEKRSSESFYVVDALHLLQIAFWKVGGSNLVFKTEGEYSGSFALGQAIPFYRFVEPAIHLNNFYFAETCGKFCLNVAVPFYVENGSAQHVDFKKLQEEAGAIGIPQVLLFYYHQIPGVDYTDKSEGVGNFKSQALYKEAYQFYIDYGNVPYQVEFGNNDSSVLQSFGAPSLFYWDTNNSSQLEFIEAFEDRTERNFGATLEPVANNEYDSTSFIYHVQTVPSESDNLRYGKATLFFNQKELADNDLNHSVGLSSYIVPEILVAPIQENLYGSYEHHYKFETNSFEGLTSVGLMSGLFVSRDSFVEALGINTNIFSSLELATSSINLAPVVLPAFNSNDAYGSELVYKGTRAIIPNSVLPYALIQISEKNYAVPIAFDSFGLAGLIVLGQQPSFHSEIGFGKNLTNLNSWGSDVSFVSEASKKFEMVNYIGTTAAFVNIYWGTGVKKIQVYLSPFLFRKKFSSGLNFEHNAWLETSSMVLDSVSIQVQAINILEGDNSTPSPTIFYM